MACILSGICDLAISLNSYDAHEWMSERVTWCTSLLEMGQAVKIGLVGCPERVVNNYQSILHDIPEA
jgi:hypothetical protein